MTRIQRVSSGAKEDWVAYLDIDALALFDRSAIFAGSADLRDVTFARGHGV